MEVAEVAQRVTEYFWDGVRERIETWPVRSNRASMLGHPCDRHVYYWRTQWENARPRTVERELLFKEGNVHEDAVLEQLKRVGLKVIRTQCGFQDDEHDIGGKIDGVLIWDGTSYPIEIKGYTSWTWERLNTVEDFWLHPKHYVRKVPVQLCLYLYMGKKAEGLIILKNKITGALKFIPCPIDERWVQIGLTQATKVNEAIAAQTPPERMPYNAEVCQDCDFFEVCTPPTTNPGAVIAPDALKKLLLEWDRTAQAGTTHKRVDTDIKAAVRGVPEIVCEADGKVFRIRGKERSDGAWLTKVEVLGGSDGA